jgi:hypothetical protein
MLQIAPPRSSVSRRPSPMAVAYRASFAKSKAKNAKRYTVLAIGPSGRVLDSIVNREVEREGGVGATVRIENVHINQVPSTRRTR